MLIENKVDLIPEDQAKNESDLIEFSERNKFIGCFRSSAKMGININESMEFLIKTIVERLNLSSNEMLEKDRKSIVLENNKTNSRDKPKDNCC